MALKLMFRKLLKQWLLFNRTHFGNSFMYAFAIVIAVFKSLPFPSWLWKAVFKFKTPAANIALPKLGRDLGTMNIWPLTIICLVWLFLLSFSSHWWSSSFWWSSPGGPASNIPTSAMQTVSCQRSGEWKLPFFFIWQSRGHVPGQCVFF